MPSQSLARRKEREGQLWRMIGAHRGEDRRQIVTHCNQIKGLPLDSPFPAGKSYKVLIAEILNSEFPDSTPATP